tara:strand:+ start:219 stop:386 length:168 start_codon:yes stop_codon:yes gene_type:complete
MFIKSKKIFDELKKMFSPSLNAISLVDSPYHKYPENDKAYIITKIIKIIGALYLE